jgi:hypothetical protein
MHQCLSVVLDGVVYICLHVTFRCRLLRHIAGQKEGVDSLLGCLEAWEMSKEDGVSREPLVMAITGPTGVGKSETGFRVAEALLAPPPSTMDALRRVASGTTGTAPPIDSSTSQTGSFGVVRNPAGLLVIQGGDYSAAAVSLYGASVAVVRLSELYELVSLCFVIFRVSNAHAIIDAQ